MSARVRKKKVNKRRILSLFLAATIMLFILSATIGITVYAQENVRVPEEVKEISEELGKKYNICPELIQAICWKESKFDANAENSGCIGIMQVYQKWHEGRMEMLGVTDLKDIQQNMAVAVDYIAELIEDGKDIAGVLMIYHGESGVQDKLDNGEISEYAQSILELSAELERKNGK